MSAQRFKVLLVEDEQPLVSLYKEYLKEEPLDITHASSGKEALKHLAQQEPDVILLDAPLGSSAKTALDAIKHGDYPAVAAAFTDGIPRYVGRSRNTPPSTRRTRIAHNTVMQDFGPGRHTV